MTLTQYLDEVFMALKKPYEKISPGDAHYDSAVNLLESLNAIKTVNILCVTFSTYLDEFLEFGYSYDADSFQSKGNIRHYAC